MSILLPGSAVQAITNGMPDGATHPSVGALISDHSYPDGTWSYCTGTLISPTVMVTAAHCGAKRQKTARVTFSPQYRLGDSVYTGQYVPDPRFSEDADLHDIAVVLFSTPIPNIRPARLPSAGELDRLTDDELASTAFTPVGYGTTTPTRGRKGPTYHYSDTRRRTSISFDRLTRSWLRLSEERDGDGGTCYGDSGGPNFLGGPTSDLLVATTISGDDDDCKATNQDYRLDTPMARAFLGKYVTLP